MNCDAATMSISSPVATGSREAPARELRVLFYLFFPSGFSGIARYTHELLTRLNDVPGIVPELACPPSYHWRAAAPYAVWPGLRELAHPVPLRRRLRFGLAQFASPSRLWKHVEATKPDIVHFCNVNPLTFPLWSRPMRGSGVPVVATVHDVFRGRGIVNTRFENRMLAAFYRDADALFVHGGAQVGQLTSAGVRLERIHRVPHGSYEYGKPSADRTELRRRLGLPLDRQVALFFGTVRDDKNLDLLLRAAAASRSSLHLLIAGEFPSRAARGEAYYRRLIDELGRGSNVTLRAGRVPDAEVADLFTAADWAALPYARSFTSQSGVLSVAAAYDRPCLVSDIGALGDVVAGHDVGIAVTPDDLDSLRQGIGRIMERVASGHAHDFEGYRRHHSWEAAARETAAVYRSLV